MNLINGEYLDMSICAFSGDSKEMFLIVYDGGYNYMLFNSTDDPVLSNYKRNRMPFNGHTLQVEYYSTFDNALDNLVKVTANNGFNRKRAL